MQHYGQELLNGNFGPRLDGPCVTVENFRVEEITVPTSLHYSTDDPISNAIDVNRLIPMLSGTADLFVQEVSGFNHLDFCRGVNAHRDVYPTILKFLNKHAC